MQTQSRILPRHKYNKAAKHMLDTVHQKNCLYIETYFPVPNLLNYTHVKSSFLILKLWARELNDELKPAMKIHKRYLQNKAIILIFTTHCDHIIIWYNNTEYHNADQFCMLWHVCYVIFFQ